MIALAKPQLNSIDEVIHGEALLVLRTLPDNSVDAIVCDPPAGISFMGKDWDKADYFPLREKGKGMKRKTGDGKPCDSQGFANGVEYTYSTRAREAFISFITAIMAEALRVLKPGGHAFVWALPRTSHWTGMALEDAGFEIRDVITHLFGSGFPKSHDISAAIDRMAPRQGMFGVFAEHFKAQRLASGLSQKQIAQHFPSKTGGMTGCVWNWENGANVPTLEQWHILQPMLGLSDEWTPLIEREEAEREVIGQGYRIRKESVVQIAGCSDGEYDITAPATPEAAQWDGWGTALKPSAEMWLHAHKPFTALGYCDTINQQLQQLEADLCVLHAKLAEKSLTSTLANSNGVKATSAQENVLIQQEASQEKITAIGEAGVSSLMMDISEYESVMTTCLNIVTSWSNIWEERSQQMSKFTTETITDLTTDLKTLNSLLLKITPDTIIQAVMSPNGQKSLVQAVVSLLDALQVRCNAILTLSAIENATEIVPSNNLSANVHPQNANETIKAYSSSPASEHWYLVRKPLSEKSIAENVLKWGVGAINIDASRVGTEPRNTGTKNSHAPSGVHGIYGSDPRTDRQQNYDLHKPSKRFPSNLLLSHSVWCVPNGVKKVKGTAPYGKPSQGKEKPQGSSWQNGRYTATPLYNDSEGMETVEDWLCDESCPVRLLDEQSGMRKSGGRIAHVGEIKQNGMYGERIFQKEHDIPSNEGGASRYFQRFYYVSKASRAERNRGCEGLPEQHKPRPTTNTERCLKCGKWHSSAQGIINRPNSTCTCDEPEFSIHELKPHTNTHPTVKPLALCRYLVRMITPPGGIVLDCFAGSGSTLVAAVHEGMHFIGIEMNDSEQEPYVTIARARIEQAFREVSKI